VPEMFKLLPVAEDEGPISLHLVRGQAHQVQDRWCSGFQLCAEADGAVAQQEAHMMTPEILEMASETTEVRKTPKSSGREQARWAMVHALEDLVREQGRIQESAERQEELLEELASNTKVITDAMDLLLPGSIS